MIERRRSPVFVVGCPRSGTNLLYDTLLSSGGFAVYRGRLPVYQQLIPRFGHLDRRENRQKMILAWVRTKGFQKSGLDTVDLAGKVVEHCRCGGDFLKLVMDEIARKQRVARWAFYSPEAVLWMPLIKKDIPEALFVHIIRDGRDVALSLRKLGEFRPFPWKRGTLEETALYWQWLVDEGRRSGFEIPNDYTEVRYEDLVLDSRTTLRRLGEFLDHDLDFERIRSTALGTVGHQTNSAYREDAGSCSEISPVHRWKQKLLQADVAALEWQVGTTLEAVGYQRTLSQANWKPGIWDRWLKSVFPLFLKSKRWMKMKTRLGVFSRSKELDAGDGLLSQPDSSSIAENAP